MARPKPDLTEEELKARQAMWVKNWRREVFIRDSFICQECGSKSVSGTRIDLNAHHIKPFSKFPDRIFDLDNGVTLCICCHREKHKKEYTGNKAELVKAV